MIKFIIWSIAEIDIFVQCSYDKYSFPGNEKFTFQSTTQSLIQTFE